MNLNLADKLSLVTGSTAGIGYAIATSLAREGARVIVNGRSQSSVDNAVSSITSESRGVGEFVTALAKAEGMSFEAFEKAFFKKARPTSLIKRFATTEEVASLVTYIASPIASATTGAALRVDGGVAKSAF